MAAQQQVTLKQQKLQTEEVVKQQTEKEVFQRAYECGINLSELDSLLSPIMEMCTKESISLGKSWILHNAQQPTAADAVAHYLLFKTIQGSKFLIIIIHLQIHYNSL